MFHYNTNLDSMSHIYYENEKLWDSLDEQDKVRIDETAKLIPHQTSSLLDAGCGNGLFLNYVNGHFDIAKLYGIDISETALKSLKVPNQQASITEIPFSANSFDIVTALEVIEHLPQEAYAEALSELARVAKKHIIVSVPFNENLETNLVECPKCKSRFNPYCHLHCFTEKTMEVLFEDNGFKHVKTIQTGFYKHYWGIYQVIMFLRKYNVLKKKDKRNVDLACPVCGVVIKGKAHVNQLYEKKTGVVNVLKKLYPKTLTTRWLVSLYEREDAQ